MATKHILIIIKASSDNP